MTMLWNRLQCYETDDNVMKPMIMLWNCWSFCDTFPENPPSLGRPMVARCTLQNAAAVPFWNQPPSRVSQTSGKLFQSSKRAGWGGGTLVALFWRMDLGVFVSSNWIQHAKMSLYRCTKIHLSAKLGFTPQPALRCHPQRSAWAQGWLSVREEPSC